MNATIRVEGLDNALNNLAKEIKRIPFRTKKGMISAGFLIQRESQKLTPVDTGNLKNSAFVTWGLGTGSTGKTFKGSDASEMSERHNKVVSDEASTLSNSEMSPEVKIGYSASYAIFVHENTEASHVKSKTGKGGTADLVQVGESKFLEKAIKRNKHRILQTIKNEGQI